MRYAELTHVVIGCAIEVINELGAGFVESVYQRALMIALRNKHLPALSRFPLQVLFRGESVGDFSADILVEDNLLLELKAVKELLPIHEAQIINYLNAAGI